MIASKHSARVFVEGPAGTGKTTMAGQHLRDLLQDGVQPESILVLVPQRVLGQVYRDIARSVPDVFGEITVATLAGLARRSLERFWPLVADTAGFDASREPIFLTNETAQYHMMQFVRPAIHDGVFDSINLAGPRIAAQLLDNMAKAAGAGFEFDEVTDRLVAAWGDRHSSRVQVYRASHIISEQYRAHCREHNLLDYAFQLTTFMRYLQPHPIFRRYFRRTFHHLIADNIEELRPLVHDFIQAWWDHWESAWLVMDRDGGIRTFLGASPENAVGLRELCDEVVALEESAVQTPAMVALTADVDRMLNPLFTPRHTSSEMDANPLDALDFETHIYYPQMIDWVVDKTGELLQQDDISPDDIVILAPFLSDSLRFVLQEKLKGAGIPAVSHRPSRALREEPAIRAVLTLMLLAHPQWGFDPPARSDVANAFVQVIDGLDPIRAQLLASIVYRPKPGALSSFEQIQGAQQERITYIAGERFDRLREWLLQAQESARTDPVPPDLFISRLFGEVLSQPGFRFHANLEAGRVVAHLIDSARKFRQVLAPDPSTVPDWTPIGREYFQLVQEGVLAAQYLPLWAEIPSGAVLLAPAYTFLMQNRVVSYQFWLDVGSDNWWKRLDQPLTHPHVLTRHYPRNHVWTEHDEIEKQREMLHRLMMGLLRRCRSKVYLAISELGEQGYEQRGPMLHVFQQLLQHHAEGSSSA